MKLYKILKRPTEKKERKDVDSQTSLLRWTLSQSEPEQFVEK